MRQDDFDPDDIAAWHIATIVFVTFVLCCVAAYAFHNIIRAVA